MAAESLKPPERVNKKCIFSYLPVLFTHWVGKKNSFEFDILIEWGGAMLDAFIWCASESSLQLEKQFAWEYFSSYIRWSNENKSI